MTRSSGLSPSRTGLRSQGGPVNVVLPNGNVLQPVGNQNQPAGNQNQNPNVPINLQPNVNVKVDGAGLDTFVPVIPDVRTEDIKELFKVKYLTKLDGEPTHDWLETIEKEMGRNALAVECSFGGGRSGCLGTVYNNARFKAKAGHDWVVPSSRGAFPIFPNNASIAQKKQLISEFIESEKDRKTVKICEELLKGQLIEAVDENFILELKDDMMDYDGVTLVDMLKHLRDEYAPQDVNFLEKVLSEFEEPPDLTKPIDAYFAKQERCQRLLADSEDPIEDRTMVVKATQHLGKDPSLAKKTVQFRELSKDQRTWTKCKAYYRKVMRAVKQEQKCLGADQDYHTGSAVAARSVVEAAEQKARDEMAEKMSGSFDALASAAVAKAATIDSHAATIAALSKANAELVETNKRLVAQLTAAKLPFSPPGFPPNIPTTPSSTTGISRGVHEDLPTVETGHKTNTAGVSCPAVKKSNNKWYFVAPQACSTCGKPAVLHVPENCGGPGRKRWPRRAQATAPTGTSV